MTMQIFDGQQWLELPYMKGPVFRNGTALFQVNADAPGMGAAIAAATKMTKAPMRSVPEAGDIEHFWVSLREGPTFVPDGSVIYVVEIVGATDEKG